MSIDSPDAISASIYESEGLYFPLAYSYLVPNICKAMY